MTLKAKLHLKPQTPCNPSSKQQGSERHFSTHNSLMRINIKVRSKASCSRPQLCQRWRQLGPIHINHHRN